MRGERKRERKTRSERARDEIDDNQLQLNRHLCVSGILGNASNDKSLAALPIIHFPEVCISARFRPSF